MAQARRRPIDPGPELYAQVRQLGKSVEPLSELRNAAGAGGA